MQKTCCMEKVWNKYRKEFVGKDNYTGEQHYNWVKQVSSAIQGTPHLNLRDISVTVSKIWETLSEGCPEKISSTTRTASLQKVACRLQQPSQKTCCMEKCRINKGKNERLNDSCFNIPVISCVHHWTKTLRFQQVNIV